MLYLVKRGKAVIFLGDMPSLKGYFNLSDDTPDEVALKKADMVFTDEEWDAKYKWAHVEDGQIVLEEKDTEDNTEKKRQSNRP